MRTKVIVITILCLILAVPGFAEPAEEVAVEEAFVAFDQIANHYKCYQVVPLQDPVFPAVTLVDQFKQSQAQVIQPRYLCNPVKKNNTGMVDPNLHYVCFDIVQNVDPVLPDVHTSNQFGRQLLRPVKAELLCLPSKKTHL